MSFFDALFCLLCGVAAFLPLISAQILPSNVISNVTADHKFLLMSSVEGIQQQPLLLDPLTEAAGAAGDSTKLEVRV